SFGHYVTQSPYYGSVVITNEQWRRFQYTSYPPVSYNTAFALTPYAREMGNTGLSSRVKFFQAAQAYAWPIATQPGNYNYRAQNETSIATWQAAPKTYVVGELVRGTEQTGWWWECTRAGTAGSSIPAAMNKFQNRWGTVVDEGAGRPEWRGGFSGGNSSKLQKPWGPSRSGGVGGSPRFNPPALKTAHGAPRPRRSRGLHPR